MQHLRVVSTIQTDLSCSEHVLIVSHFSLSGVLINTIKCPNCICVSSGPIASTMVRGVACASSLT